MRAGSSTLRRRSTSLAGYKLWLARLKEADLMNVDFAQLNRASPAKVFPVGAETRALTKRILRRNRPASRRHGGRRGQASIARALRAAAHRARLAHRPEDRRRPGTARGSPVGHGAPWNARWVALMAAVGQLSARRRAELLRRRERSGSASSSRSPTTRSNRRPVARAEPPASGVASPNVRGKALQVDCPSSGSTKGRG